MKQALLLLTSLALLPAPQAMAEFIFSAPPRESAKAGQDLYAPLVKQLSKALGELVVYERPHSWAEYAANIRNNKYDIVFDGPHFSSWRLKHTDHQPVSRLSGKLDFTIASLPGTEGISDLHSLRTKSICTYASPNLTASVVLDPFRDSVVQPAIVPVKGNMKDIYKALESGRCHAAVFRSSFYAKGLNEQQREKLQEIHNSRKFPNQGITASARLSETQVATIRQVLNEGSQATAPIIKRFTKGQATFITAQRKEYDGLSQLLEGIVWGW